MPETIRRAAGRVFAVLLLAGTAVGATAAAADARPAATRTPTGSVAPFAGSFHPIEIVLNGAVSCLQPTSPDPGARVVLRPCDGSQAQGWASLNRAPNHYNFLNTSGWCMSVDSPASGTPVILNECTLSDGSGRPVSNAEWNTGRPLPDTVKLNSRYGFVDRSTCADGTSGAAVLAFCNTNSPAQRWIVSA